MGTPTRTEAVSGTKWSVLSPSILPLLDHPPPRAPAPFLTVRQCPRRRELSRRLGAQGAALSHHYVLRWSATKSDVLDLGKWFTTNLAAPSPAVAVDSIVFVGTLMLISYTNSIRHNRNRNRNRIRRHPLLRVARCCCPVAAPLRLRLPSQRSGSDDFRIIMSYDSRVIRRMTYDDDAAAYIANSQLADPPASTRSPLPLLLSKL